MIGTETESNRAQEKFNAPEFLGDAGVLMTTTPETFAAQEKRLREELESLFAEAHREILGTLFYMVGSHDDAHDALQETFLKCWRNRQQIENVGNLKAWVFCIALNTGRDIRKAAWNRRRRSLPEETEMVSSLPSAETRLVHDRSQWF